MKKNSILWFLPCILIQSAAFGEDALQYRGHPEWGWNECFAGYNRNPVDLRNSMLRDSCTQASAGHRSTTISVQIDRGQIDKPIIKDSSGNAQFDFDCLQAVLGQSRGSNTFSGNLTETFSDGDLKKSATSDIKSNDKQLYFYVVPLSISQRFGVGRFFTEAQLLDSSNIATIPNAPKTKVSEKAVETLRKIYCEKWPTVIGDGWRPRREDIMRTKQEILLELKLIPKMLSPSEIRDL